MLGERALPTAANGNVKKMRIYYCVPVTDLASDNYQRLIYRVRQKKVNLCRIL